MVGTRRYPRKGKCGLLGLGTRERRFREVWGMTGNVDMLFWKRTKENSGVFVYNFKFIIFFVLNSRTNGKTECLSHFGFQIFATK